MKIFITGSTGFIGKNLVEFYSSQGCEVFAYTRDMNVVHSLYSFAPNIIINCAAEIYKPELMWQPNVELVRNCLEYVKQHPCTVMVQIGSSSEYGIVPRASRETDPINPVDMYQATKGTATLLCQGYARSFDLNISIARPYSVYGRYERPHRFFPKLWQAFKLGHKLTLSHGYHDFIYIDDFVRGIDLLVKKTDKPLGDIVNFGSGIQYSNMDVLKTFEKVTGHTADVTVIDKMIKKFESDIWVCDTNYAQTIYGFNPQYSLTQGIKVFLETAEY